MEKLPPLPLTIRDVRPHRAPLRAIELICQIRNPTEVTICILDAWSKVETVDGLDIDEGRLFAGSYARIEPAAISPRNEGYGELVIHLPDLVLYEIEDRRAGGDLKLRITSRLLVATVVEIDVGTSVLSVPYETEFGNGGSGYLEYMIAQSKWVEILRNVGWSELEIIELPTSRLRAIPVLVRAVEHFEEARACFQRGDWTGTMLKCRLAFEAVAREAGQTDNTGAGFEALLSPVAEEKKRERLDSLLKALGEFQHLGRHEHFPRVSVSREDAQLSLHLTGALLTYLGKLV